MKKKSFKTDIIAGFLMVALALGAVAVWFSGAVGTTRAAYEAGDVKIEAGRDLSVPGGINMDNWNPGDENLVTYKVDNTGTLPANLSVALGSYWKSGLPGSNVVIAVAGDNAASWVRDAENPDVYVYNGTFSGTVHLYLSVKLLGAETGNAYQSQTFVLQPTFTAWAEEPPTPPTSPPPSSPTPSSPTPPSTPSPATPSNPAPSGENGDTGVAGEKDITVMLPQTGGASASTVMGIAGLVLAALGSASYIFLRKRESHKQL